MKNVVIALDIGGTSIKSSIIDESGSLLYKESFYINSKYTSKEHISFLIKIVDKLYSNMLVNYRVIGLGVCAPGVINNDTLHMGGSENIPGLRSIKFSDIGDRFNLPTKSANDANAAALGESKYGSNNEKEYSSVLFITLGTGIGGGLILNGKLFTGSLGGAGELGHVVVVPGGNKCNCGSSGCIEQYASSIGFINTAKQKIYKNVLNTTLNYEILEKEKVKAIFDAAKSGDILAKETISECSYYLGISIAQVTNILDLDLVLIGGGLSNYFYDMKEHIERGVRNYALSMMSTNLVIKKASLGNDAGVLGCAALFFY